MANPNNLTGIGHPGDPAWQLPNLEQTEDLIRAHVEPRFKGMDEDIDGLLETMVIATMRSESHRDTHEKANVSRLNLSEADKFKYAGLACDPERVGEAIHWLGGLANTVLDNFREITIVGEEEEAAEQRKTQEKMKRIGFELGGNLQFGNWETTGLLDAMARSIPRKLNDIDRNIRMTIYGPRREDDHYDELDIAIEFDERTLTNNLLMPRFSRRTHSGQLFDHAMLRRRRAVADVYVPGIRPIEIYKDSNMVIVPSQLSSKERAKLYGAYWQEGFNTKAKNNAQGATVAGNAAERAIKLAKDSAKDKASLAVHPIGAHYVMKLFKDGRGMAKSLAA